MESAAPRSTRSPLIPLLLAAGACLLSAVVRWRLAGIADWGVDEAANLWLGGLLLSGDTVPLGLVSSRGIPNMIGAPLLAAPLSLLPDLVAVSRALALLHLLALAALGWAIGRDRGSRAAAVAALVALTGLGLFSPAVHLAGFAAWPALLLPVTALLLFRPRRLSVAVLLPGIALVAAAGAVVYAPWLGRVAGHPPGRVLFLFFAGGIALASCLLLLSGRESGVGRRATERLLSSRLAAWVVPVSLVAGILLAGWVCFSGSQAAGRLLAAGDPWGTCLRFAQLLIAATALPALVQTLASCLAGETLGGLLAKHAPGREVAGALLAAHSCLAIAGLALVEPQVLLPHGRPDLLMMLVPALAAPLLLFGPGAGHRATRRSAGVAVVAAGVALLLFALISPVERMERANSRFISAESMRETVDLLAARHRAGGGGPVIDVGYDLAEGREWIAQTACSPRTSWYVVSRPFDGLLLRRHGLRAAREGSCDRTSGGTWQVGYRGKNCSPGDYRVIRETGVLELREPLSKTPAAAVRRGQERTPQDKDLLAQGLRGHREELQLP